MLHFEPVWKLIFQLWYRDHVLSGFSSNQEVVPPHHVTMLYKPDPLAAIATKTQQPNCPCLFLPLQGFCVDADWLKPVTWRSGWWWETQDIALLQWNVYLFQTNRVCQLYGNGREGIHLPEHWTGHSTDLHNLMFEFTMMKKDSWNHTHRMIPQSASICVRGGRQDCRTSVPLNTEEGRTAESALCK